ncbi:YlxR family protein [Ilumatobacter sp.]|uniref:YlxR family protein n=1 Tax=Ilumatobacter sp. TaxID=1967498 RepID=UPI003C750B57
MGCRTRRPARQLVRLTRSTGDVSPTVEVDGASSGRGAWLCRDEDGRVSSECVDAAVGAKQFARAWKTSLDVQDIEAIRRAIDNSPTDE